MANKDYRFGSLRITEQTRIKIDEVKKRLDISKDTRLLEVSVNLIDLLTDGQGLDLDNISVSDFIALFCRLNGLDQGGFKNENS